MLSLLGEKNGSEFRVYCIDRHLETTLQVLQQRAIAIVTLLGEDW
ncbi:MULTISPECIES: hypothetical protein [unclassified Nostoc]|nr:hypothetical protein [Nostoc sp. JL31]